MRRAAPTIPVTAKMLRHFAVIAIAITSGLAMFASGEGQQLMSDQVKQRQQNIQAVRTQRQEAAKRTVVVDGLRLAPGTRLGPADVDSPSFVTTGPPVAMEQPAIAYGPAPANGPAGPAAYGVDRDAKGAVIPPPAAQMRMRGKPGQPQPRNARPRMTQQDVDAIVAASAQRAGGNSSE